MKYNPEIYQRRSIRLKSHDYSRVGVYFVTVCTQNRECLFGDIVNWGMILNEFGQIAHNMWKKIPDRYSNVELDIFRIMPNHMHAIIVIGDTNENIIVGAPLAGAQKTTTRAGASPAPTIMNDIVNDVDTAKTISGACAMPKTIGDVVGSYKSMVANECLKTYKSKDTFRGKMWQRNYYEHIIRDDELNRVREYIANNPAQWEMDEENPNVPHEGGSRTAPTPAKTERAEPLIYAAVTGKIDVRGEV